METCPTGAAPFDELLEGGYEPGVITTLYGPAGSGKTTTCLLAALSIARQKKVIFIDTEGGFSPVRFNQLSGNDKTALENLFLLHPTNFSEQKKQLGKLPQLMSPAIGLIVCDTVSALYRNERGEQNNELNRELAKQLGALLELARTRNIPVLVTTQVYADFEDKSRVNMVGGDLVKYTSKCIIELQMLASNTRRIILRKHRSLPEKTGLFTITSEGFQKR